MERVEWAGDLLASEAVEEVVVVLVVLHLTIYLQQLAVRMAAQVGLLFVKQVLMSVVVGQALLTITARAEVALTVLSGLVDHAEPHRSLQLA